MKRVILVEEKKTVDVTEIDLDRRVYALSADGTIYKLHRYGQYWLFCSLDNSDSGCNGKYRQVVDLLQSAIGRGYIVYEFEDQSEFLNWADNKVNHGG